jgi:hypothetical protein
MNYESLTARIGADYDLFLAALSGRYWAAVAPGAKVAPQSIVSFIRDAAKLGDTFAWVVDLEIESYLAELYDVVPDDATLSLSVSIRAALTENIAQVARLLRTGVADYSAVLKDTHGAMGLVLQQKLSRIDFKLYDTANRKCDARRLMGATVRDFAYQAWIDRQVELAVNGGHSLGQVKYADPQRADQEIVFSLGAKVGAYPTLDEIRSKVFHPNATASVIPYVSS